MKKCPFCAEEIQDEAIVCRFCGKDLRLGVTEPTAPKLWSPGIAGLLSFLIPGAGSMYKGEVGFGVFWFFLTIIGYLIFFIVGLVLHLAGVAIAASGDPSKPPGTPDPPAAPTPEWKAEPLHPALKWVLGVMIGLALLGVVWGLVYQRYGYEIREYFR